MPFSSSFLIETPHISEDNLANFLDALRGCWKCSSLLWMQSNSFPVLSGLILSKWTQEAEAAVSRFCRERNFSEFLVRIEKRGQRWTRRRGGYTIPVSGVRSLVDELAQEGMLALLLEPASPCSDLYSLTSVCGLETGKIDVEIVGPGFDASDILRSDLTPHERFEILDRTEASRSGKYQNRQIRRSHLVEPKAYRASAHRRLAKIGARLRNPSFPEEELRTNEPHSDLERLVQEAVQYLKRSGQTLLLDHLNEYQPIPTALLETFLAQLMRLLQAATEAHVPWKELSVAGSFLKPGRLVMWDFFTPGNGETRLLSTMKAAPLSD